MYSPLRNSRIKLSVGQIFWREIGQGPDLVFLHGSWHDSSQWLGTIEYLSRYCHCLAPDLLGFGESKSPNIHFSIDLEVHCLAEYLDTLKLREVYLVGHSLGGWVAASFAVKYPDRVQGLILLAPEGVNAPGTQQRMREAKLLSANPPWFFWLLRSVYPLAKLLGSKKKFDRLLEFRKQLLESDAARQLLFGRNRAEIKAELVDEQLPVLKARVLLLHSSQDTPFAAALCQSYAALIPSAQLESIDSRGGDLPQEMPDFVAKYIQDFVK
ncbi:MAG: alpha/beta hydrolase [Oscillatoriaceae cyanobacterium Prado104]|jgi:pimeloyl-ACP methyl ester carboxylesterase|nr:alpha/beta hydrolase [Oscillatoriaceae cyanobacterium Prado104]